MRDNLKKDIKKSTEELMGRISLLPLLNGNKERVERVKRVWRVKGIFSFPKIF